MYCLAKLSCANRTAWIFLRKLWYFILQFTSSSKCLERNRYINAESMLRIAKASATIVLILNRNAGSIVLHIKWWNIHMVIETQHLEFVLQRKPCVFMSYLRDHETMAWKLSWWWVREWITYNANSTRQPWLLTRDDNTCTWMMPVLFIASEFTMYKPAVVNNLPPDFMQLLIQHVASVHWVSFAAQCGHKAHCSFIDWASIPVIIHDTLVMRLAWPKHCGIYSDIKLDYMLLANAHDKTRIVRHKMDTRYSVYGRHVAIFNKR